MSPWDSLLTAAQAGAGWAWDRIYKELAPAVRGYLVSRGSDDPASVAVATVGVGVGVAADAAIPGEAVYRMDRAMEQVGIADGGAAERVEEARKLVDTDLPEAVASAG